MSLALVPTDGSRRLEKTFFTPSCTDNRGKRASRPMDGLWSMTFRGTSTRFSPSCSSSAPMDLRPPRELLDEPANDLNPFWTPDGQHVFFASDRAGIDGGLECGERMIEGVAQGEPSVVARNLGLVYACGAHQRWDVLLLRRHDELRGLHASGQSCRRGTSRQAMRVPSPRVGGHVDPSWSAIWPSGLCDASAQPQQDAQLGLKICLTILEPDGVSWRDVKPQLFELGIDTPRWSPDKRHLVVKGTGPENLLGYFQVDVDTGETKPIVLLPRQNKVTPPRGVSICRVMAERFALFLTGPAVNRLAQLSVQPDRRRNVVDKAAKQLPANPEALLVLTG